MTWAVGIDIGGTAIKCVAVDARDATVLKRASLPTRDGKNSMAQWTEQARGLLSGFEGEIGSPPVAVGVSAPGLAAPDHRSIAHLPVKLKGLEGFDWTDALRREALVPVLNDAHAALLGEAWTGAARGQSHVALLTLGTGIGGAVLSHGRLLEGAIGRAGHIGHLCLDPEGPKSIVGMPGGVEVLFGDGTVSERTDGRFASTRDLVRAFEAGDAQARRWWLRSVRALGCAIASCINLFDPEAVVLVGGIARAGYNLLEPLKAVLDEVEWRPGGHAVPIVLGELGEWAGAIGAARFALARCDDAPGDPLSLIPQ